MKLSLAVSEIAARFGLRHVSGDAQLSGAQLASSLCQPGDLFIATQGAKFHGVQFLDQAVQAGAVAILTDPDHIPVTQLPILVHDDPRSVAGAIAAALYDSAGMKLLGVTGTNGKTSTITYLHELLLALGEPNGMSASTLRVVGTSEYSSSLTTPEVTELHRMLSQMKDSGQGFGCIEVSAQAMVRNRVDSVEFAIVGFTNLSRDHLDDFGSMDDYLAAKARLFTREFAKSGVILVEDEFAKRLTQLSEIPVVTIAEDGDYSYQYQDSELKISGASSLIVSFSGGELMAKNLVLALVMLLQSGFTAQQLETAVKKAHLQVPGRLERVSAKSPAVYVDYAHTPAGVAAAVSQLRSQFPSLTVILGASGNRDQGKRPAMAEAAASADHLIITDQHPRYEDPALIRLALVNAAVGAMDPDTVFEVADPTKAMEKALAVTAPDGAILWCGPGHLNYREVAGVNVPFDARALAKELVER